MEKGTELRFERLLSLLPIFLVRGADMPRKVVYPILFACIALIIAIAIAIKPQRAQAAMLWRNRAQGEENVLQTLENMEKALDDSWFSCLNKPVFFCTLLIAVFLIVLAIRPSIPLPAHMRLDSAAYLYSTKTVTEGVNIVLEHDEDLGKDAQKLLKKAASRMYHPDSMSVDRFYIASVAAELIDKGAGCRICPWLCCGCAHHG